MKNWAKSFLQGIRFLWGKSMWGRVLMIAVASTILFVDITPNCSSRFAQAIFDAGHVVFFFGCSYILIPYITSNSRFTLNTLLIFCSLMILLACGSEVGQIFVNSRNFNIHDIFYDLIGSLLAILVYSYKYAKAMFWRLIIVVFVAFLLLLSLRIVVVSLVDEYVSRQQFPILADFESPFELSRWVGDAEIERSQEKVRSGNYSAKLRLNTNNYSGVQLSYFPRNWSSNSWLNFSVFTNVSHLELHFRVHDKLHGNKQHYENRFNGREQLKIGWNDIKVSLNDVRSGPEGRDLDLTRVEGFGIFVTLQHQPIVLYLDDVRLSN